MTNILGDDKQQQVLALGRLGWPLRRIEAATGVRRETASAYLKAAGIPVRLPRRRRPLAPKPASEVSTDPGGLPAGLESLRGGCPRCADLRRIEGAVSWPVAVRRLLDAFGLSAPKRLAAVPPA